MLTGAIITLVIIKTNKKPKAKDNTADEGSNTFHKHTYTLYFHNYIFLSSSVQHIWLFSFDRRCSVDPAMRAI